MRSCRSCDRVSQLPKFRGSGPWGPSLPKSAAAAAAAAANERSWIVNLESSVPFDTSQAFQFSKLLQFHYFIKNDNILCIFTASKKAGLGLVYKV